MYCLSITKLLLESFIPYIHKNKENIEFKIVILEKKAKSLLTLLLS